MISLPFEKKQCLIVGVIILLVSVNILSSSGSFTYYFKTTRQTAFANQQTLEHAEYSGGNTNTPTVVVNAKQNLKRRENDNKEKIQEEQDAHKITLSAERTVSVGGREHGDSESSSATRTDTIDQIYYISRKNRPKHRDLMVQWLQRQPIPYQYIEQTVPEPADIFCDGKNNNNHRGCRRMAQEAMTYQNILNNYNTSGLTLILPDRVTVDIAVLMKSLELIPPDFDVVRWNCWGQLLPSFKRFGKGNIFRTACTENNATECESYFCGGTASGLLFRDSFLGKLREFSSAPFQPIGCQMTTTEIKSFCINNFRGIRDLPGIKMIEEEEREEDTNLKFDHETTNIDRIYYINVANNTKRNAWMQDWLTKQPVPFSRINANLGTGNYTCRKYMKEKHCRGAAGLIHSNFDIMDNYNTSGLTLVLEDDFKVENMTLLMESIRFVPPDFDVIRWSCWGIVLPEFQRFNDYVFRTACTARNASTCSSFFCGGTHATLWRDSGTHKLRNIWSRQPYRDLDCALTTTELNSYCINGMEGIGAINKVKMEKSIPKL